MAFGGVRQRTRIRPTVSVSGSGTGPAGPNTPPAWQTVADFSFTEGIAAVYSIAGRVSDPGGSVSSVALNSGSLPTPRLQFNTVARSYDYNGAAGPLTQTAYTLIATDNLGLTSVSNAHNLSIQAITFATPSPVYDAGVQADFNLSTLIPAFDASHDVITVDASGVAIGPGSSHTWLTLAGPGGSLLRASGAQIATDDFSGLRLRVTRNSGPIAICNPITVVVNAVVASIAWQQISVGITGGFGSPGSYATMWERSGAGRMWLYFLDGEFYDPIANTWTTGAAGSIGKRENIFYDHDTVNNVFWSPACLAISNPAFAGTVYYDPVAGQFVQVLNTTESPTVGNAAGGWCQYTNRLYAFGGFGTNPSSGGLRYCVVQSDRTLNPKWDLLNPAGPKPPLYDPQNSTGETYLRGGIDSRTGDLWVLADDQELYRWTMTENRWRFIPTTGPKPPQFCCAVVDEGRNIIVAHTGYNDIFDPVNALSQTHILDLSTLVWTLAVNNGTPNPPSAQIDFHITYDRIRKRTTWDAYNKAIGGQHVWELKFPTTDELNIPNQTFVARSMPNLNLGITPWVWGYGDGTGKHSLFLNDKKRRRVVMFGGDFRGMFWYSFNAPAAQPETYAYNAATDTWSMLNSSTPGPGTIIPCRPNDGNPLVHDTKRDRYWALPGGWAAPGSSPHQHGSVINITMPTGTDLGGYFYLGKPCIPGATLWNGLMWMDPDTTLWTGITNASIGSPDASEGGTMSGSPLNAGIYDPINDCIHSVGGSQNVYAYRVFLNDNPALITVSQTQVLGLAGLPGGDYAIRLALQHPCFDVLGRKCYILTLRANDGTTGTSYVFFSYDMDNPGGGITLLANPPMQTPVLDPNGTGGSCKIFFDTKNRRVLWPKHDSPQGIFYGMASYNLATNAWTTHTTTISPSSAGPVCANEYIYDETHNCLIMGGSDGEGGQSGFYYLWRFA